jgi:hypothetical protein
MSIKNNLVKIAEKITGRKCSRCAHNRGGRCCHPNGKTFMRCWQSITRPGFAEALEGTGPADLTPEERHQIAKIVETLKEASATAQDGGLLEDSDWFEG